MTLPQENAIGIVIVVTVIDGAGQPMPIDDATTKDLIFKKPDGTMVTVAADFVTDGTDGQLKYETIDGDLTPHGTWEVQAYIVTPTLNSRGKIALFDVARNI